MNLEETRSSPSYLAFVTDQLENQVWDHSEFSLSEREL